jgi:hypothetical protein
MDQGLGALPSRNGDEKLRCRLRYGERFSRLEMDPPILWQLRAALVELLDLPVILHERRKRLSNPAWDITCIRVRDDIIFSKVNGKQFFIYSYS